jgi:hypothetical protein
MHIPDDLNNKLDELLVRLKAEHSVAPQLANELGIQMCSLKLSYPAKDQYGQKKRQLAASLHAALGKQTWVSDTLRKDIQQFVDDLKTR